MDGCCIGGGWLNISIAPEFEADKFGDCAVEQLGDEALPLWQEIEVEG